MTEEAYIKIFHKYVEKGLDPFALVVYSLIANYCENFGECSLSNKDIAYRTNVKDPRAVLERLTDGGYITKERTKVGNIYKISDLDNAQNWDSVQNAKSAKRYAKECKTLRESVQNAKGKSAKRSPINNTNINQIKTNKDISGKQVSAGENQYTLFTICRKNFEQLYREIFASEFYFSKKEIGSLANLIKQIEFKMRTSGAEVTDDTIADTLTLFCKLAYQHGDKFVKNNFSVSIINSKFNEIYGNISTKRGNSLEQQKSATDRAYEEMLNDPAVQEWLAK